MKNEQKVLTTTINSFIKTDLLVKMLVAFLLIMPISSSLQAETLKMLTCYPMTHIITDTGVTIFEKNLKEISNDSMDLKTFGPNVVPVSEQFQPIQSGVFDLLFTTSVYHMGTTAMGVAIEATEADIDKRRERGLFGYMEEHYSKLGVKLLAVMPVANYNIITSKPLADSGPSFSGLKLRVVPTMAPTAKALGASVVNIPPGEIYTGLQKGVIDGFSFLAVGLKDFKIHEVAKYLIRPTFAYVSFSIFMNKARFDRLTPDQQEYVIAAAIKSETDGKNIFRQKQIEEEKFLISKGMQIVELPPSEAKQLNETFAEVVWDLAEKKTSEVIGLHKLADENGLSLSRSKYVEK
jgi:TRAP-type C4-dicarboxylate transport system substrate-binding protein